MIAPRSSTGYSSEVHLELRVGQKTFELGQVLPDRCMVRDPIDVQPGPAVLTISVDGRTDVREVVLRDGIRAGEREVVFE